jgi:hypothetical protein
MREFRPEPGCRAIESAAPVVPGYLQLQRVKATLSQKRVRGLEQQSWEVVAALIEPGRARRREVCKRGTPKLLGS